jgi:hypothetical protein
MVVSGNREIMEIDGPNELLHIFLDRHANKLVECFGPSGWVASMAWLLEYMK